MSQKYLSLSEIRLILDKQIYNVNEAVLQNVSSYEDYCRLVGKIRGIETAFAALEYEINQDNEDKDEFFS